MSNWIGEVRLPKKDPSDDSKKVVRVVANLCQQPLQKYKLLKFKCHVFSRFAGSSRPVGKRVQMANCNKPMNSQDKQHMIYGRCFKFALCQIGCLSFLLFLAWIVVSLASFPPG